MARLAIHPGEQLQDELEAIPLTAEELAEKLRLSLPALDDLLQGRSNISADTALRLGHFFGTGAEFWMNLQAIYDLRVAEAQQGEAIKALPTLKQPVAA
ncbi:HigA family addiction module antitoxin [Granulicella paludicola]|uniref:HigA family addiction module antitoxin n=1 Tax=Granulicella paludicola TaxID=474951 RepID=UPI0021E032FE|nr:HigA family addiction module antitoxin [Granulicella paludicola]